MDTGIQDGMVFAYNGFKDPQREQKARRALARIGGGAEWWREDDPVSENPAVQVYHLIRSRYSPGRDEAYYDKLWDEYLRPVYDHFEGVGS